MTRLLLLSALVAWVALQATPERIVIDGAFDDWARVPIAVSDPVDAPGSAVDFGNVRVHGDARHLFVMVEVGRTVNVQGLNGTMSLLIDEDGNQTTGDTLHGANGVDLAVDFSPTGGGVQVRRFPRPSAPPPVPLLAEIHLAFAPRYAATRFEFRLDRGVARNPTLKLVFVRDGKVIDETTAVTMALPDLAPPMTIAPADRVPETDPIAREAGASFRVAVWNVNGLVRDSADVFARILGAIDADVLMLDEVSSDRQAPDIERWLPTGTAGSRPRWRVLIGPSGGGQRSLVAVRGELEPAFGKVPYAADGLEALLSRASADDRWIDRAGFDDRGVGTTGAAVVIGGRRLLVVSLDMTCCGQPGSYQEARRQLEAQAIRAAVGHVAVSSRADGVLIGGDFNLVGTRDPLDILMRGLDLDGSDLAIVEALRLDGLSKDTWRAPGGGGRFPPGRLDWLLHSDASMEVVRAFVLDTEDLAPYWLKHHRRGREDSADASDHLPIVADLRWKR